MTDFADEARSRTAHLLRMANTANAGERARLVEYADSTPEPPVMGPFGIGTKGCPHCRRTMWQQQDVEGPIWVCASCGHVEPVVMTCPKCRIAMTSPRAVGEAAVLWSCPACLRAAATGDSAADIERRERRQGRR